MHNSGYGFMLPASVVARTVCSCRRNSAENGSLMIGLVHRALQVFIVVLLPGCDPPYLSDTYTTSTPEPKSFDTSDLAGMPVVVLAFVAPANLQGFSPTMSHALSGALAEVNPADLRNLHARDHEPPYGQRIGSRVRRYACWFRAKRGAEPTTTATDWIGARLAIRSAARTCTAGRRGSSTSMKRQG